VDETLLDCVSKKRRVFKEEKKREESEELYRKANTRESSGCRNVYTAHTYAF